MFEKIQFISYKFSKPVTYTVSDGRQETPPIKRHVENDALIQEKQHDNLKNVNFSMSGRMDAFSRPPVKDFVLHNLYHMEAFSIFYSDKNFYTQRKDYNSYLLLYTYEGNGLLEYDGKTYRLSEGDGFLIDCRLPQLYTTVGDYWKHSVLHLNGPLMPSFFEQYNQTASVVFSQPITGNYQIGLEKLLMIYSTAHPYRDWQASDCISSILTDLLLTTYGANTSPIPENLQYLIKYMENNFSSAITLDYLSTFSGISKYYLSREFKKYTGFSPNDYLIQLRVEHAKYLLHSTSLPANKIAHIVGIHDMNNFTNLFKKKTGMSPGQFRKTVDHD